MAIIRARNDKNYTVINNIGLRDDRLSWKARGLLSYMLSLPDDWIFRDLEITNHAPDGKESTKKGLKELEQYGYLVKQQSRGERGKFATNDWLLYEVPLTDLPLTDNPPTVKPLTDKPIAENPPLLSTNELSTKDTKKDTEKDTSSFQDDEPTSSLIDLKDTGSFLLRYYANTYLEVKGKKHPKVPIDQISELIVGIEEVELRDCILDYEQIPELIDYHFDNLPSNNDGKIYAFNHLEYKSRIAAEFLNKDQYPSE